MKFASFAKIREYREFWQFYCWEERILGNWHGLREFRVILTEGKRIAQI